jgi:hypothetical protein
LTGTFKAALAGFVAVIVGATALVLGPVVKLQGFGTPPVIKEFSVRSVAALEIAAVY